MPFSCPTCTVSNPDAAIVCVRCGASLGRTTDVVGGLGESVTVGARPSSDSAERSTQRQAGSGVTKSEVPRSPIHAASATPEPLTLREGIRRVGQSPSTHVGGLLPPPETRSDYAPLITTPAPPAGNVRLVVVRGEWPGAEFAILDGRNYIGRSADKPVDIDLEGQERAERVWASRQHAVVARDAGGLILEDLNSLNGTFVNRVRVQPGHPKSLTVGDVIQIGTVQLKVVC